jgi:two-component system, LytTR family, response regulator
MTRALIIEDEPEGLVNLQNMLAKHCPDVDVVATGSANADLIRLVNDEKYNQIDVAFLDVSLPDGLIFQGLQQLEEIPFDIIFVTAFDSYALTAFDFSAIDYVLKPIEPADLQRAVSRIRVGRANPNTKQRLQLLQQNYTAATPNSYEKIGISGQDGIHFVRLSDIVRLDAQDNYTHFLLRNGERITAAKTIKTYEEVLGRFSFLRVHKSSIVNMNYMKTFVKDDSYLVLENGDKVEVSRRKRPLIVEAMRRLFGDDLI